MIRILIVDDDISLLRSLERLLAWKRTDFTILTANDGEDAIRRLQEHEVDAVLTDLDMPRKDGFELVAWILSNQPHVAVAVMTAYPSPEAMERLRKSGGVECFTKPLDASSLCKYFDERCADDMSGHLRNISLASLLQLMEMERKTCTLLVRSAEREGRLIVNEGSLVHARYGEMEGEDAAIQIAAWPAASVDIKKTRELPVHTINKPLRFIIMEACRLIDEAAQSSVGGEDEAEFANSLDSAFGESVDSAFGESVDSAFEESVDSAFEESVDSAFEETVDSAFEESVDMAFGEPPAIVEDSESGGSDELGAGTSDIETAFSLGLEAPAGADVVAVVHMHSGRVEVSLGDFDRLEAVAQLASRLFVAEAAAIARLGLQDFVEEIVITSDEYWSLIRPLASSKSRFALLVFDPRRVNLGMERLALDGFMLTAQTWLEQRQSC